MTWSCRGVDSVITRTTVVDSSPTGRAAVWIFHPSSRATARPSRPSCVTRAVSPAATVSLYDPWLEAPGGLRSESFPRRDRPWARTYAASRFRSHAIHGPRCDERHPVEQENVGAEPDALASDEHLC